MTNPHPLTEVEVTPEDYEIAERANVLWGRAINGPHVAVLAAAMGRLSTSAQPSTEAVKLAEELERISTAMPDGIDAGHVWDAAQSLRQSPSLPSIDEVERIRKAVAPYGCDERTTEAMVQDVVAAITRVDAPKGLDDG